MGDRDKTVNFIHAAPELPSGIKLDKYVNLEGIHSSLIYYGVFGTKMCQFLNGKIHHSVVICNH